MDPSLQIQPTNESYADSLRRTVDTVARERRYLASISGFTIEETLDFIRQILGGAGAQYVALENREIVGWCDILRHKFEGFEHVGVLGMGVISSHRHRGIGKNLLRATMDAAARMGISRVELEVFASNEPAIGLYKAWGFVQEGIKKDARKIDGQSDDIVCMAFFMESDGHAT